MNKELNIRRRISNIYNKGEDDFSSLREYNDYLEETEDIVFNLVEGIDVQATEARIAAYQEEHAEQIIASRAKKAERIAASFRAAVAKRTTDKDSEVEQVLRQHYKYELIALLISCLLRVNEHPEYVLVVLLNLKENLNFHLKVKETAGRIGIQAGATGQYAPSLVAGSMFMQPRPMGPGGQPVPLGPSTYNGEGIEDPAGQKIREERGARAGGWTAELGRRRAFEEAFSSLWVN